MKDCNEQCCWVSVSALRGPCRSNCCYLHESPAALALCEQETLGFHVGCSIYIMLSLCTSRAMEPNDHKSTLDERRPFIAVPEQG